MTRIVFAAILTLLLAGAAQAQTTPPTVLQCAASPCQLTLAWTAPPLDAAGSPFPPGTVLSYTVTLDSGAAVAVPGTTACAAPQAPAPCYSFTAVTGVHTISVATVLGTQTSSPVSVSWSEVLLVIPAPPTNLKLTAK